MSATAPSQERIVLTGEFVMDPTVLVTHDHWDALVLDPYHHETRKGDRTRRDRIR